MPGTRFTDIRRFGSVDSTNRYLLDEARSGAPEGVVAVAGYQTAGRGRLGRRWEAPPGSNLLVSVLLRPSLAPGQRHLATGAVALAAGDAAEHLSGAGLALKWPNDLIGPDGQKVAGILAEGDVRGPGAGPTELAPAVVVGIGINVNWPAGDTDLPPELVGRACSLRQLAGHPLDLAELLDAFLVALEPRVDGLGSLRGRAELAESLRSRCATIGAAVRVEGADEIFDGRAIDLTADGHLVVEADGRRRTVQAGDVIHLRPGAPDGRAQEGESEPL